MKSKEIGQVNEVELTEADYLVHIRGNPAEEALLIRQMLDAGKTQTEIGTKLSLSQPQISKRLSLLSLDPRLFDKIRKGELRPSAGYLLSKLPKATQGEYANKGKITIKDLEKRRRDVMVSKDLETLLLAKSDLVKHTNKSLYRITVDMSCPWLQHDPLYSPEEVGKWLTNEIKGWTRWAKIVTADWAP